MPRIIEGTWEEIKAHEAELAGRNVRLIVEQEVGDDDEVPPYSVQSQAHLEELHLQGLRSGPTTPMTENDWDEIRRKGRELAISRYASAVSS